MRFLHSIRWRLQLWHGLMFVLVLGGFGFTAWQQQFAIRIQRVDQELERRVAMIGNALRRGNPPPAPPDRPNQRRPRPPEEASLPRELRLPPREESQFEAGGDLYYVVWQTEGPPLARSAAAPPEVPPPARGNEPGGARSRGQLREYYRFTPEGECILLGRDIRQEWAEMQRFGWILAGLGTTVLLLGWAGGWWISTRALRPVADIGTAANRIAGGDLSQRIPARDTDSELGELVRVLNDTFARLQASFDRQAQFTADASHELRTPVSVILTQTQGALTRERPAEEYREALAACQRAARRMRSLTDSLLTLARLDSAGAEPPATACRLDQVTADGVDLLRAMAEEHGVEIETALAPAPCRGDPDALAQVVSNLLANAIYHNRPGGLVQVTTDQDGHTAVLRVTDNGDGIAADDLPHIFERFYRADKARSQTVGRSGLGLAIVKAIVDVHCGAIKVSSEPGRGSTFTVVLPTPIDAPV